MKLDQLPPELTSWILSYTDLKTLACVSQVNHRLNEIVNVNLPSFSSLKIRTDIVAALLKLSESKDLLYQFQFIVENQTLSRNMKDSTLKECTERFNEMTTKIAELFATTFSLKEIFILVDPRVSQKPPSILEKVEKLRPQQESQRDGFRMFVNQQCLLLKMLKNATM